MAIYLFLFLFFALFGHLGFDLVNQVILWVIGPVITLYILEPNLGRLHTLPGEYWLYISLFVFSLVGYINVTEPVGYFRYLQTLVANFVMMVVIYYSVNSVREWRLLWGIISFVGLLICLIGFVMDVPTQQNSDYFRLSGIIGNSNGLATFARISILGFLLLLQFVTKRIYRIAYIIAIIFLAYAILLTASRGNFGNLLFILGGYLVIQYFRGWKILILFLIIFVFGGLLLSYGEEFLKGFYLFDRLTRNDSVETALEQESRAKLYALAWQTFLDHPFLGVGLNQFRMFSDGKASHTDILDILVQLGIFAGMVYTTIYVKLFFRIRKLAKRTFNLLDVKIYRLLLIVLFSEIGYGLSNPNWFTQVDMFVLSLLIVYTTKIRTTAPKIYIPQKKMSFAR